MDRQVGAYGTIDRKTGELLVEGNIYDPNFQTLLDNQNIDLRMAEFPEQEGAPEDSFNIAVHVAENGGLDAEISVCVLVLFPC